jgi:hypothetical protein
MLRTSFAFFGLGLLAVVLGEFEVGGMTLELGRLLLLGCLGIAVLTFVAALVTTRGSARRSLS